MIIPNEDRTEEIVLNLIINGLPSILSEKQVAALGASLMF